MASGDKNPFRFGDPVGGKFYLGRPTLQATVNDHLLNQLHVVLIGPRRFGKTSFLLDVLREQAAMGKTCLHLDVYNITSHRDFLQQLLRAFRQEQGWGQRLKDWLGALPRLRPRFAVENDPLTGKWELSFAGSLAESDVKEAIQDLLAGLEALGGQVIVAIDEFQKVAELDDHGWLEATLRTYMQRLPNTSFLFTGSRRSIIDDMFNNQRRPFYRSASLIDFPPFGLDFTRWIVQRFATAGIECREEAVDRLRREVQDTPNYVQMVCFHLAASGVRLVTVDEVLRILPQIVHQNAYGYQTLLSTLSPVQQRALRLSAIEDAQIYSRETLARYEIGSGPALGSALKALKNKNILDESTGRGRVVFDDPLFAIWLRAEFG